MNATFYNTFSTKPETSRVVIRYETDATEPRDAMNEAVYRACMWNKTEERDNMRVTFVLLNGQLRAV